MEGKGFELYTLGTGASYYSKDVSSSAVIAVIDTGINWCHPAFLDENGKTRILFYYETDTGKELNSQDIDREISKGNCGSDDANHGTPVTGIIAGDEPPYRGIAPASEIIVVKVDADGSIDDADVIEALDYLKEKRKALKKPFVVNISLGKYQGPRDGTDFLDRKVDEVSGGGFVVVTAAGNSGDYAVHARIEAVDGDREIPVHLGAPDVIEGWYTRGMLLSVEVCRGTNCITALPGELKTGDLGGCDVLLDNTYQEVPLNGDGAFYVEIGCSGDFSLKLRAIGGSEEGIVDLYLVSASYYGLSYFGRYVPEDLYGGVYGTVASPGTSSRAITVGAYISKPSSTDFSGESFLNLGKVSSFSSRGPTRDGRIKPDVSAGGMWVWSASADGNGYVPNVGTSFSAPVVAGLVALYLQLNPDATPEEVKHWLTSNAVLDDPAVTERPNNTYGYGKARWVVDDRYGAGSGGCSAGGSAYGTAVLLLVLLLGLKNISGCAFERKGVEDYRESEKLSPSLKAMLSEGKVPSRVLVIDRDGKVRVVELGDIELKELIDSESIIYIDIPKPLRRF